MAQAQNCPRCSRPLAALASACSGCGLLLVGADPRVGRLVAGKYRIEALIGEGGMGAVFRATQLHGEAALGQVVVKFLHAAYAADPERRARFLREAQAARELRSQHVVKVFDFGEDGDSPYLVMEYLEGRSLYYVLAEVGRLPWQRVVLIGAQVAEAMVECHERGIVHRDLKPDNLLLLSSRSGDFVKIVDFGIARVTMDGGEERALSSVAIGTPRYMAPEQLSGEPIDRRIDIFALGVILFEAVCGEAPIALQPGEDEMAYVTYNLSEPPRRASALLPEVPVALDRLLFMMMAKDPAQRPTEMSEVLAALEALARSAAESARSSPFSQRSGQTPAAVEPEPPSRRRSVGLTLLVVLLLSLGAMLGLSALGLGPSSMGREKTPAQRAQEKVSAPQQVPQQVFVPREVPAEEPPPRP